MQSNLFIIFTLASALIHAVSYVYSKRLFIHTSNPAKVAFFSMFSCGTLGLFVLPFFTIGDLFIAPGYIVAMTLFAVFGNMFMFEGIRRCDASFAVPMMGGLKIFCIAGLSALFLGETYKPLVYVGAAGAVASLFFLNDAKFRAPLSGLFFVFMNALMFAATDLLILLSMKVGYSIEQMVFFMFTLPALASIPIAAIRLKGDWTINLPFAKGLLLYSFLVTAGGLLIVFAISSSGQVTIVNIVQSVRGLLAIFVVYLFGKMGVVGLETLTGKQVRVRGFGALLMCASVTLAVISR